MSPFSSGGGLRSDDDDAVQLHERLASELSALGLAYTHVVDPSSMGMPPAPAIVKDRIREAFAGALILAGGYDLDRGDAELAAGRAELLAFGRPFIATRIGELSDRGADLRHDPDEPAGATVAGQALPEQRAKPAHDRSSRLGRVARELQHELASSRTRADVDQDRVAIELLDQREQPGAAPLGQYGLLVMATEDDRAQLARTPGTRGEGALVPALVERRQHERRARERTRDDDRLALKPHEVIPLFVY